MNASEWTCVWYLRLNGYFTMPNFIAHGRPAAKTDVDVLAIRLGHSFEANFQDDKGQLKIPDRGTDVVFVEVKEDYIGTLNGPWANRAVGALDYVLKRVGIVPASHVKAVADALYDKRSFIGDGFTVRICAFGASASKGLVSQGIIFVDWKSVFEFIHNRFRDNNEFKRDHCVWDGFGKYLWQNVESCPPTDYKRFFQDWNNRNA